MLGFVHFFSSLYRSLQTPVLSLYLPEMSQQQQQQKKAERSVELLDECWELIFNRLGDDYRFEVISLVSKQFLSVSSRLKRSLTINERTIRVHCNLSHFFRRFNNLSRIKLMGEISGQELNDIVLEIARSGLALHLEQLHVSNWTSIDMEVLRELGSNMTNLRTLKCKSRVLKNSDLVAIASSIPQLRKLDISFTGPTKEGFLTDEGIEALASKVTQLERINLFGNWLVTDNSLIALSLNCKFLTQLVVGSCKLTENGICFALRHCQNLRSLRIHGIKLNNSVPSSTLFSFQNPISHARALSELELHDVVVSDVLLCSIAKARLPLKKLALFCCENITYSGLSFILQEYQSTINHLSLGQVMFLTDQMMNDLSMFMGNVTHLDIWYCSLLTNITFFILTANCPFLVELKLESVSLGRGGNVGLKHTENHNIRYLELGFNTSLNDKSLKSFGLVCPNIQLLNLSDCSNITDKGIGEILKSCSKLTHLEVDSCKRRRILGTGSELSKLNLKVLQASHTMLDDEGMALIGTRCPGLLELTLVGCRKVTQKGVKEVLESCVNLKEINLMECWKVSSDIVPWMMSTRPSLRKIFLPGRHVSKEEQRNLWLRHGCLVNYH